MLEKELKRSNSIEPIQRPKLLRTLSSFQYPENKHTLPGSVSYENESLKLETAQNKSYWQKTLTQSLSREKYLRASKKKANERIAGFEKGWKGKGELLPHEKEFVRWESFYR